MQPLNRPGTHCLCPFALKTITLKSRSRLASFSLTSCWFYFVLASTVHLDLRDGVFFQRLGRCVVQLSSGSGPKHILNFHVDFVLMICFWKFYT
jgi:hypothetical protein